MPVAPFSSGSGLMGTRISNGLRRIVANTLMEFRGQQDGGAKRIRICTRPADPASRNLSSNHRTKSIAPKSNRFVTDAEAALGKQILDVSERKRNHDI